VIGEFGPKTETGIISEYDWNILQYLLITPPADKEDIECTVAFHDIIKILCHSKLPARDILKSFQERFALPLNISYYGEGRATTVKPTLSEYMQTMLNKELQTPKKDKVDKVNFRTGESWSMKKDKESRKRLLDYIQALAYDERHPALDLITYLHSDKVEHWLYKQINLKADPLRKYNSLEPSEVKRVYCDRIIHAIESHGYVGYTTSDHTARIFGMDLNILALPKPMREIFFDGCYSIDIKSSQAAITAYDWNSPKMQAFLSNGSNSLWKTLLDYCGLRMDSKDSIKKAFYAMVFGTHRRALKSQLKRLGIPDKLLGNELIVELLDNRDAAIEQIITNGGAYDAFDKWLSMNDAPINRSRFDSATLKDKTVNFRKGRSILANRIQSIEMKIMLGGFAYVKNNPNLTMRAFLHDGMYLTVDHNKGFTARYIQELCDAIKSEAVQLGIDLFIEQELLLR
jgi:hypothetical protein